MKKVNKFSLTYIYLQLVKQSGDARYIARGDAIGLFIGMVIPFGVQMPIAVLLAFLFKAAKIPAVAFTWVTNHFTIFLIYPVQCWIGSYLIGNPLKFAKIEQMLNVFFQEKSWSAFMTLGGQVVFAFFAGGLFGGILLAVPGYFISLYLVKQYRLLKELKLKRRQRKLKKRL